MQGHGFSPYVVKVYGFGIPSSPAELPTSLSKGRRDRVQGNQGSRFKGFHLHLGDFPLLYSEFRLGTSVA
jgi:hypothetical protein